MLVIKRNGSVAEFDKSKIVNAILKAMRTNGKCNRTLAEEIANTIENEFLSEEDDEIDIYDIEKKVYLSLINHGEELVARAYEGYRAVREFQRENENTIDNDINTLIDDDNEYWNGENANKNPVLNTTKRDYMAGTVSTDSVRRYLLSPEIIQAHDDAIIHFHDADYFIQKMNNCCVFNLEDMLQNGTVLSETKIDKPKTFLTACTITSQIVASVASNQYGL